MLTVEALRKWGADTDDGLKRCMNNEAFFLNLVGRVAQDPSFDGLKAAVEAGDLEKGFELAHALKGMSANLSLTPICNPVQEITELLRNRTQTDYSALLEEILSGRDWLLSMV